MAWLGKRAEGVGRPVDGGVRTSCRTICGPLFRSKLNPPSARFYIHIALDGSVNATQLIDLVRNYYTLNFITKDENAHCIQSADDA
jgi:hypothetical protein